MTLAIRRARSEDAAILAAEQRTIAAIPGRLASRPEEIHEHHLREVIETFADAEHGSFLVAIDGDVLVGHAFLEPLSLAAVAHVVKLTIAVHEGHHRRGIGRALMNELLAWARANPNVEKVELQVRASNAAAIALYQALGFVEEGRKTKRLKVGPGLYLDDVYLALWVGPTSSR